MEAIEPIEGHSAPSSHLTLHFIKFCDTLADDTGLLVNCQSGAPTVNRNQNYKKQFSLAGYLSGRCPDWTR